MKKKVIMFLKIAIPVAMLTLEVYLLVVLFSTALERLKYLELILRFLAMLIIVVMVNYFNTPSFDLPFVMIIAVFPITGALIFLIQQISLETDPRFRQIVKTERETATVLRQKPGLMDAVRKADPVLAGDLAYISDYAKYPFYDASRFTYYPLGDAVWPVMLEKLKEAKRFIFIEYCIIGEGKMWDSILEILKEKVKEGVDVRVIYDDIGSLTSVPYHYDRQLEKLGIRTVCFNRLNVFLAIFMNHRDHRKIMDIDGNTVFSGGINLTDDYVNLTHRLGVWKDNGFMIQGEAVYSYTVMFLRMWSTLRRESVNYSDYKPTLSVPGSGGCLAPYSCTPFANENIGENIYLNLIHHATRYVWISTPYLILDSDMITALTMAAKRGVDVRIVTPGIPDKKIVYSCTRSNYYLLLKAGVRIWEYTPGFIHAKIMVCDDQVATVGTVNLDYRSLYLHFECGTYLYRDPAIQNIRDDLAEVFTVSRERTLAEQRFNLFRVVWEGILKLIAPMM